MTGRLQDKVAIVTGAGRGIGAAIAHAFAREGAAVVIVEKDERTGSATAAAIAATGAGALFVPTDVTSAASVEDAAARTLAAFGHVDILVNNAGINVFHKPHETTEEEWRRCFDVDLDGVWRMTRAVLPALRAQRSGAIVNIASSHAFTIIPGTFPYPVAKHGLIGLTRALGVEYAPEGIRVNAIAPGYIETDLAIDYWNGFPDPDAARRRISDLHPVRRLGRPEEVAMTAVFLASDEAGFMTATCLMIDGGRSALNHE